MPESGCLQTVRRLTRNRPPHRRSFHALRTTVFVVDDDRDYLDSLSALVQKMSFTVRAYSSGTEYLELFDPECPGVLLLDVRMPRMSGIAVMERLSKEPIRPPIIVLTGYADVSTAVLAFRKGAMDCFQKTLHDSELHEALQKGIARDADLRRVHFEKTEARARLALLSERERQVLDLVLSGMSHKSMAARLGISKRAVEDRRSRMIEKLEVASLPHLVRLAMSVGLTPNANGV